MWDHGKFMPQAHIQIIGNNFEMCSVDKWNQNIKVRNFLRTISVEQRD